MPRTPWAYLLYAFADRPKGVIKSPEQVADSERLAMLQKAIRALKPGQPLDRALLPLILAPLASHCKVCARHEHSDARTTAQLKDHCAECDKRESKEEFRKLRAELDPGGVFASDLSRRLEI